MTASTAPLLEVEDLVVDFNTPAGWVRAVDHVSWDVSAGEIHAVVGESGSGKSVTALAVLRLLESPPARLSAGAMRFAGRDLQDADAEAMRQLRGRHIGMVFQEPMTGLNPLLSIGRQLTEGVQVHLGMSASQARARAIELLEMVGIADPERRLQQYPHHLSGGMRQRVMIAMALSCRPELLIADEPTTALDVTIQAQILDLIEDLCRRLGVALVIITHNLGVVARYADRVTVMYAGRVVEDGTADDIYRRASHPYTAALLESVPRPDLPRSRPLEPIPGNAPDILNRPNGCAFRPRCRLAETRCAEAVPPLVAVAGASEPPTQRSACLRVDQLRAENRP